MTYLKGISEEGTCLRIKTNSSKMMSVDFCIHRTVLKKSKMCQFKPTWLSCLLF